MKKRNKLFALVFILVLLLSACGSKPAGEGQEPSSTQEETAGGTTGEETPARDDAGQRGADDGLDVEALR